MSRFPVEAPLPVHGADPSLGALGPALERLAAVQGGWPPRAPASVRRLVVVDGHAPTGSVEVGREAADALADAGADLLVLGSAGDPVPGLVAAAALLALEPVRAVGTSAVPAWAARTVAVRDGLRACRPHLADPDALLDALGGGAVAELAGLLAQCAVRRTPVLLDGSALVAGAALVAERLAPGASGWWLAGQAPPAPAAAAALADLGLRPLLQLGLDRPEGAALAELVLMGALELLDG